MMVSISSLFCLLSFRDLVLSVGRNGTLLLDACLLTSELTEVVELSAANLTNLVNLDRLDVWRLDREDTLYTYST